MRSNRLQILMEVAIFAVIALILDLFIPSIGPLKIDVKMIPIVIVALRRGLIPGILSGIILSVGRVIGESAAILLTAGTVANMPGGIFDSARSLTVHAYLLTKEKGDIGSACSIGIVLIIIVLGLNTTAKLVAKKLNRANY